MSLAEQLAQRKREKTTNESPSAQLLNLFSNIPKASAIPKKNEESSQDTDPATPKTSKITIKSEPKETKKSIKQENSGNKLVKKEGNSNSEKLEKKSNKIKEESGNKEKKIKEESTKNAKKKKITAENTGEKSAKSEKSEKSNKSEKAVKGKSERSSKTESQENSEKSSKKDKKKKKATKKSSETSESQTGKSLETENEGTLEESENEAPEDENKGEGEGAAEMSNEAVSKILDTEEDKKLSEAERREKLFRTIFVGNLSTQTTVRQLTKFFSKYGKVESVRFRSVAVAKPTLPKKVSFITKQFNDKLDDIHAYVVFESKDDAKAALSENAQMFKERHIRVDLASNEKGKLSNVNSVFVGNLPYDIPDESLWQHFGACGAVTAVRVVRDPHFRIGRGIAYVMFSTPLAVRHALQLDQSLIGGRKIRVSKVTKNPGGAKNKQLQRQRSDPKLTGNKRNRPYQGKEAVQGKKPRFHLSEKSAGGKPKSKAKNKQRTQNPNKNRKKS